MDCHPKPQPALLPDFVLCNLIKKLYHFKLKNLLVVVKIIQSKIKRICFVFVKILYAHTINKPKKDRDFKNTTVPDFICF